MKRPANVVKGIVLALLLVAIGGHALAQEMVFDPVRGYQPVSPFGFSFGHLALEVVAGIFGFLIGAFFSPLLRPFRRIAVLGAIVLIAIYTWFFNDWLAGFAGGAMALLIFGIALGYGLRLGVQGYKRLMGDQGTPSSYGTAKWSTRAHLAERNLFSGAGFFLGAFEAGGVTQPLHYRGDRHLLTVAPTRTGKGVSAILPNLLTYGGSALVVDPKGENALITAARRGAGDAKRNIEGLGQQVFLLDPWDLAASATGLPKARFNPLDWIQRDDPDAAENAMLLADAIVTQEPGQKGGGDGRFWEDESKALLAGIILYVAISPDEEDDRTLGRVRDILAMDQVKATDKFKAMAKDDHPVIKSTGYRTLGKEPKLLSSVMATTQSHTHFLDSPRIRESLSRTDFTFEQLKTTPTTVYLILPADRLQTYGRWLRLLIQQAITVNARNIRQKPEKPVLFLLDEMPSFGRLTMIEQAYGLMAGFGIQLWGIVQDLSQLQRLYGMEGWQTFISNSGVVQYFGSRDEFTASYFSKLCGVKTIRKTSFSYALGRVLGSSFSTSSGSSFGESSTTSGTNESTSHTNTINSDEAQRQLAYPDELMVLKGDSEIIFIENFDPIQAKKVRWLDDPELRPLGVNLVDNTSPAPPPLPGRRMVPDKPPVPAAAVAAAAVETAPTPAPTRASAPAPAATAAPAPAGVTVAGLKATIAAATTAAPRTFPAPSPSSPPASQSSKPVRIEPMLANGRLAPARSSPVTGGPQVANASYPPKLPTGASQDKILPPVPSIIPRVAEAESSAAIFSAVEAALLDERGASDGRVEKYNFEQDGIKFTVFTDGSIDLVENNGTVLTFPGQAAVSEYLRRNR